jgi:phosphohistidine phosphatase SixA
MRYFIPTSGFNIQRLLIILSLVLLTSCNFGDKEASEIMEDAKKPSEEITTYYFIRHAEKDTLNPKNKDPQLTETGVKRANNWAKTFKDIDFDLIYSSDYKRTRNTARSIAESQNKKIKLYDSEKLNSKDFQQETENKTVLVVGHSNLNPKWVNYILGREKYKDLDESVYGSLFIVTVHPEGSRTSQLLYLE